MAGSKKKSAAKVQTVELADEAVLSAFSNEGGISVQNLTSDSLGRKHVALDQLYIVREYIDRKNAEQDNKSITDEAGVYGMRIYSGKFQCKDKDGNWNDIVLGEGGTGVISPDIANAQVASDDDVSDLFGM